MDFAYVADYYDCRFMALFCDYFMELGISLKPNDEVFSQMQAQTSKGLNTLSVSQEEILMGFLMYQEDILSNWFFQERVGFIHEFYVRKEHRGQGLGRKLMKRAILDLRSQGIRKLLLTASETAIGFYEKEGFKNDESYQALNKEPTFTKTLG